jgi:hypothetical protein
VDAGSQYALAYALTTSAGIRAMLPLALFSLAVHAHVLAAPPSYGWLGSTSVTAILIAMALVEFAADKIPFVDHALHVVQALTKPAAAAILVGGSVHAQSHQLLVALMVAGALNALGVHGMTSTIRLASSATTAGAGNPLLSLIEDAASSATAILAVFAPFAAAIFALLLCIALFRLVRGGYRRLKRVRS